MAWISEKFGKKPERQTAADHYILDRHISKAEDDLFGHGDFASELAELALAVPMPTNIAIYSPWGTGKTGLAHLLCEHIGDRARWVYFDAFKYPELPLRRQFLRKVWKDLGENGSDPRESLLHDTQFTTTSVDAKFILKLTAVFVLATAALMFIPAALIAWYREGPFGPDFREALKTIVPLGAIGGSLISGFFGLANRSWFREHKASRAQDNDEFEIEFDRVLDDADIEDGNRVIVFIDELDRCSARHVVGTLEALKTFLDSDRCVFVVAADQQVLETALAEAANQVTPVDLARPYYSVGGAYLDKIFQHQLTLPPMRSRRLADFAVGLIPATRGIWKGLDVGLVADVLVPNHVTSPRRVKVLLNEFALLATVAQRRFKQGKISGDLQTRATELAKLACLRCEFPAFARDLERHPTLPAIVPLVNVDDDDEALELLAKAFDADAVRVAYEYRTGIRLVDGVIADSKRSGAHNLGQQHADQLADYLERTYSTKGPTRELIYLEGPAVFILGLDQELAEKIEQETFNSRPSTVAEIISGAESAQQAPCFEFLTRLLNEAPQGRLDHMHASRAIFTTIAAASHLLTPSVAARLEGAVTVEGIETMTPQQQNGLAFLALASGDTPRAKLMGELADFIRHGEAVGDTYRALIERDDLSDIEESILHSGIASLMTTASDAFAALVDGVDDARLMAALDGVGGVMQDMIAAEEKAAQAAEAAEAAEAALVAAAGEADA